MNKENLILAFVLGLLTIHQLWMAARIDRIADGLHEFGSIPAGIRQISNGNTVTIESGQALPNGPRTVEQVADALGVTPDTVRDAYIPAWIEAGHMSEADRRANRWLIPPTFDPYRTR